jgi:hypothetical protein
MEGYGGVLFFNIPNLLAKVVIHVYPLFDFEEYRFFTPANADMAKEKFLAGRGECPEYERSKLAEADFETIEREILGALLDKEAEKSTARTLYEYYLSRKWYQTKIAAFARDDDGENFRTATRACYGKVQEDYFELARAERSPLLNDEWLRDAFLPVFERKASQVRAIFGDSNEEITSEEAADRYSKAFLALGYPECHGIASTEVRTFAARETDIFVPNQKLELRRKWLQVWRMFWHEGFIHAMTCANGRRTNLKLLGAGTAHYEKTQEGLAMLFEAAAEGTFYGDGVCRAKERYLTAGIADGLLGSKKSVREVFDALIAETDSKPAALYSHIENAYRAIIVPERPDIYYNKLIIYYDSLLNVVKWFRDQDNLDEALNMAMVGKYDFTEPVERENVAKIIANWKG